jgi:hypothetical protein
MGGGSEGEGKSGLEKGKLREGIKMLLVNCGSVLNKVLELSSLMEGHDPDVIIGTESWLSKGIGNREIFLDGYNVFRRDRRFEVVEEGRGEGFLFVSEIGSLVT